MDATGADLLSWGQVSWHVLDLVSANDLTGRTYYELYGGFREDFLGCTGHSCGSLEYEGKGGLTTVRTKHLYLMKLDMQGYYTGYFNISGFRFISIF